MIKPQNDRNFKPEEKCFTIVALSMSIHRPQLAHAGIGSSRNSSSSSRERVEIKSDSQFLSFRLSFYRFVRFASFFSFFRFTSTKSNSIDSRAHPFGGHTMLQAGMTLSFNFLLILVTVLVDREWQHPFG